MPIRPCIRLNDKGNSYQFYSADLNANLQERLTLENECTMLWRENCCIISPKSLSTTDTSLVVERWQNPARGLVSCRIYPNCRRKWSDRSDWGWVCALPALKIRFGRQMDCPVKMAVNLSARQFKQQNLVEMVAQVLKETRLDATYLELELTESLVMENVQQAIAILQQLHDMGITLSLDDFGTGYSSLNYLKRFPIHALKIDQSFVTLFSTRMTRRLLEQLSP